VAAAAKLSRDRRDVPAVLLLVEANEAVLDLLVARTGFLVELVLTQDVALELGLSVVLRAQPRLEHGEQFLAAHPPAHLSERSSYLCVRVRCCLSLARLRRITRGLIERELHDVAGCSDGRQKQRNP
jgi:hypothetical protein